MRCDCRLDSKRAVIVAGSASRPLCPRALYPPPPPPAESRQPPHGAGRYERLLGIIWRIIYISILTRTYIKYVRVIWESLLFLQSVQNENILFFEVGWKEMQWWEISLQTPILTVVFLVTNITVQLYFFTKKNKLAHFQPDP